MRTQPRKIDIEDTSESVVSWIEKMARKNRAPGAIVPISGTDSLLTLKFTYEAFKRMGKADKVLGVHFCPPLDQERPEEKKGQIACVHGEFNWVAKQVFPWIREQMPEVQLELNHEPGYDDDNIRWGRLFSRAVSDIGKGQGMSGNYYWPVGTRNATEDYLGTFSLISRSVSMQPIIDIYKSEVLEICEAIGVPQVAIDLSKEVDCDCGRFDTAAHHMNEVDAFIMKEKGELAKEFIKAMPHEVQAKVMEFVLEQREGGLFRLDTRPEEVWETNTPYRPRENLVVIMD